MGNVAFLTKRLRDAETEVDKSNTPAETVCY